MDSVLSIHEPGGRTVDPSMEGWRPGPNRTSSSETRGAGLGHPQPVRQLPPGLGRHQVATGRSLPDQRRGDRRTGQRRSRLRAEVGDGNPQGALPDGEDDPHQLSHPQRARHPLRQHDDHRPRDDQVHRHHEGASLPAGRCRCLHPHPRARASPYRGGTQEDRSDQPSDEARGRLELPAHLRPESDRYE